jgi:hypothetical protein
MKRFKFNLNTEEDLILLDAFIDGYLIRLALDTAASHTVIDTTALILADYPLNNSNSHVKIETASGIIEAKKIAIKEFKSIGLTKNNFELTSYDFIASGLLTEIDGVLGLDFFRNLILTIDFVNMELWIK